MGAEADLMELLKRLDRLEHELKMLRLVSPRRKALVSFRGLAKLNVPLEELDKSIERARRSLFRHE